MDYKDRDGKIIEKPEGVREDILEEALEFLDDLRKVGTVNMFGAPPFVESYFGPDFVNGRQSREIVSYWMKTFEARHLVRDTQYS